MKKICVTEQQMNRILLHGINEAIEHFNEKEQIVIDWLNNHYKAMDIEGSDENGLPQKKPALSMLDTNKQMTNKLISPEMVYYQLQSIFKRILIEPKSRNEFLWNTLNKWFYGK